MNRPPRLAILGGMALTIMGGSPGARASTFTQTIPVALAPPLTPAQIDRLKHVTSWDLEFTARRERSASGAGLDTTAVPPFPWTFESQMQKAYHVKAGIAGQRGQSDCHLGTSNRCVVQYGPDGKVEEYGEHFQSHETYTLVNGCPFSLPMPFTEDFKSGDDAPAVTYVPDGTQGKSAIGRLEFDYTQNPPLAYGTFLFDDAASHHQSSSSETCQGSTSHESDGVTGFVEASFYPASNGCCLDGDTQVRIEHGAFVIHGKSNEMGSGIQLISVNSPSFEDPNNPIGPPFNDTQHYEWVLREHDCQDTNGNGNSDDDDDGLCDNWETDGIDVDGDNVIDLPLNKPPYNADPEHKDLFVEVDYMRKNPADPNDDEKPSDGALNMVKNAFAFAPVTNPDGLRGVRLHFVGSDAANPDPRKLVDEALPHSIRIGFPKDIDPNCPAVSFDDLKKTNFGTAAERADPNAAKILEAKARAFRYAIFAHQQADSDDGSGTCVPTFSSGVAELPGNDLIVTVGGYAFFGLGALTGGGPRDCFHGESTATCAKRHIDAATFMHEFGHTLGLHHGGGDDVNCKPNYLSVMNYSFQFRDVVPSRSLDYSGGVAGGVADDPFAPLDQRSLSEPDGIAGPLALDSIFGSNGRDAYILLNHPIDWNLDPNGRTDETRIVADIARRDANGGCSRGKSVDVQNLTLQPGNGLRASSVPDPNAFTVHVNGSTTVTPAFVAIANNRVYLTLPTPAGPGDTFILDYTAPAANPLLDSSGSQYPDANGIDVPNITGDLKTLFARDDWATLQYDMRLAPEFDDGATREPSGDPEMTQDDMLASASQVDFDGDGIPNALDNCSSIYNPGQEDLDADGYGDDCEPTQAADDVEPTSMGVASPSGNPSGWNNSDVTVSLSAADDPNGSGVREIDFVMNGAQSEPAQAVAGDAATRSVTTEGETAVKFFAVDNAGNPELPHALSVKLDKTPPTIVAAQDPAPNASGWNNTDVTVSFTCGDTLSGLASCDAPAVIASEGAGLSVTGNAADVAGNAAQLTVSGINIDRTAPGVTCSVTPSVLWPPKHKMIPVTAAVNVSDALSGPNGFVLTSVTSSEPDSVNKKDKPNDIQGFVVASPSTTGQLRAERIVKGPGRVYTLTWAGTDQAGNTTSCSATVTVPKKKPKKH